MNNQIKYHGIGHLGDALEGSSKVLLVCDPSFPYLNIKADIEAMDVPYVVFSDFTPNPLYEDVCNGVDLFNITQCDTILAVGGGSSLDVAKCIKLYCRMDKDKLYLEQEYKDTGIKLIAIPTTAGTGSESTRYAVIYYDGKKQSVTHDSIIPDVALLEPKVLKTLPLYQKKCTMLDALCQGIESWWSVNSTDESKEYSKIAVETIMKWWREYIFENTDESAKHIMEAANYAGRAICITQTTAPHAFSYKITSLYKLPHGHAVSIGLPEIWQYMFNNMDRCIDGRGQEYLAGIFSDISRAMGCDDPDTAVSMFRQLLSEMDINGPVATNREEEIEILSHSVNPIRLKNNPVELDEKTIKLLYNRILTHINIYMTGEILIEGKPFYFERHSWVFNEIPNTVFTKELAKECLLLVKTIMDGKGIPFLLMHGTLLGAYRDGEFINHDVDIDLAIYESDDERFKSIIPDLYDAGIKICRYHYGIIYSFIYKGLICDIDVIQKAKFPFNFRYYRVLTELVPKNLLSDYTYHAFLGVSFLIPQKVEHILAYEYGKDWRIPQKGKQARISPIWMKPFKFVKRALFFVLRRLHLRPERNAMEE